MHVVPSEFYCFIDKTVRELMHLFCNKGKMSYTTRYLRMHPTTKVQNIQRHQIIGTNAR
jgi:hypothetical protein